MSLGQPVMRICRSADELARRVLGHGTLAPPATNGTHKVFETAIYNPPEVLEGVEAGQYHDISQTVCQECLKLFNVWPQLVVSIWLVEGEEIVRKAWLPKVGRGEGRGANSYPKWAPHPVSWAVRLGKPILIDDVPKNGDIQHHETDLGEQITVQDEGIRSLLVVPLLGWNEAKGALYLASNKPHQHSQRDVEMAQAMAAVLVSALENAKLNEEERRRSQELETLFKIASLTSQPGSFEEKCQRALEEVADAIQADWTTLRLPDERGLVLRLVAAAGPAASDSPPIKTFPVGLGLVGCAFEQGQVFVTNDYPNFHLSGIKGINAGLKSVFAMPVMAGGKTLGVLSVASLQVGHFTDARLRLIRRIGEELGGLLDSVRLIEEQRMRSLELETLANVARILVQVGTFKSKAKGVLVELAQVAQADWATLRVPDGESRGKSLISTIGLRNTNQETDFLVPFGETITAAALHGGKPIVVDDYPAHPHALRKLIEMGTKSQVAVPVTVGGQNAGVVIVSSRRFSHFTPERVALLSAVVDGLGALLQNAQLYEEVSSELEQGRRRMEAFRTATSRLALEEFPYLALQHLVNSARDLIGAECGALALWDSQGEIAQFVQSRHGSGQGTQHGPITGMQELASFVKAEQRTVRSSDYAKGGAKGNLMPGRLPKSFLGVPFTCRHQSPATFCMAVKEGTREFSADDQRLLELFALLAGVLLDNLSLYQEAEKERESLSAIQGSMAEGLVVMGSDWRVVYCNKAMHSITGTHDGKLMGKSLEELLSLGPEDTGSIKALEDLRLALSSSNDGPRTAHLALSSPRTQDLALTSFGIPTVGSQEQMTGLLVRDVTQERELERRRDSFVSIASHELRTPMTAIMGFSKLLLQQENLPQNVAREWLQLIHRNSERLAALVDALLNVSRIQSGRVGMNLEPVELGAVAEEILESISPSAPKHRIEIEFPANMPLVSADRGNLVQVFTNLLDNAVKYSPGGGTVRLSAHYEVEEHRVVVEVADQGIGIAAEDQARIFETFERVDRPETESIWGSGLGLYIVEGLVEGMPEGSGNSRYEGGYYDDENPIGG